MRNKGQLCECSCDYGQCYARSDKCACKNACDDRQCLGCYADPEVDVKQGTREGGPEKTEARRNEVRNKCEHKNILDIGCNDPKTKWCNDCGAICFDYNPDYWRLPLHQR